MTTDSRPTEQLYNCFQVAYDYFNAEIFANELPACIITVQRKKRSYGYFAASRWVPTGDNGSGVAIDDDGNEVDLSRDEIALNPEYFGNRSTEEVLSTLVHEMVHQWQVHFANPGRGRYHNAEWADKMEEIGLMPSDTGAPGGKRTGDRVSHWIIEGGIFEECVARLVDEGFILTWLDAWVEQEAQRKAKKPKRTNGSNRVKYACECGQACWAKPDAMFICGLCEAPMAAIG